MPPSDLVIAARGSKALSNSLDEHIRAGRESIARMPDDDEDLPRELNKLVCKLDIRSRIGHSESDLKDAIFFSQRAVRVALENHADQWKSRNNLKNLLIRRYQMKSKLEDLEEAICHAKAVLNSLPTDVDDEQKARHQYTLGGLLHDRYQVKVSRPDLDGCIFERRNAIDLRALISVQKRDPAGMLDRDPEFVRWRNTLGVCLYERYQLNGSKEDLEESIMLGRYAVELTSFDFSEHVPWLNGLVDRLIDRYRGKGNKGDLDEAIRLSRTVISSTHSFDIQIVQRFRLASHLCERFRNKDVLEDLNEAIELQETVVSGLSTGNIMRGDFLNNLAVLLSERYRRLRSHSDLERALRYGQDALQATPVNHPERARRLNNRGDQLRDRFRKLDNISDLDEAIRLGQEAIDTTPYGDQSRTLWLNNLGLKFRDRYECTFFLDDLEEAIKLAQIALDLSPIDSLGRTEILNSLASRFSLRYFRLNRSEDLHRAIELQQESLNATPSEHPKKAIFSYNLSDHFHTRYKSLHNDADLEEAIRLARLALFATPEGVWNRGSWLHQLSFLLEERYERSNGEEDLGEAIQLSQEAITSSEPNYPLRSPMLFSLGRQLKFRYQLTHLRQDLEASTNALTSALDHPVGRPLSRILAGRAAAYNFIKLNDFAQAAECLEKALALLPKVTPRSNSRQDFLHILRKLSGLAPLAASVYLKAGKSHLEALQILERGRGVLASIVMDARSDTSELRKVHPELHQQYTRTRETIASFSSQNDVFLSVSDHTTKTGQLRKAVQELEEIEKVIRTKPGFQYFQQALTEKDFLELAKSGPLVAFNLTYLGSHAFVVSSTVKLLTLPQLKIKDVEHCVALLSSRSNPGRRCGNLEDNDEQADSDGQQMRLSREAQISSAMKSLWYNAVKPVLDSLGFQERSSINLPCIWWVGGGLMALVPLHALGDQEKSQQHVIDRVISSYAPTFKSLQTARRKAQISWGSQENKLLVVGMPRTPGHVPLDVLKEISSIEQHIGSRARIHKVFQPNKQSVLNDLPNCTIAHFACHGFVDNAAPQNSALLLGDAAVEYLTIADLDSIDLHDAQIAYLSACSTAEIAVRNLLDESFHLVSSFQLVGFRHVIGTMWGAEDEAAVIVANKFYEYLLRDSSECGGNVARALHEAIHYLKSLDGTSGRVAKWAPFIHVGP